ncbi:MAG: HypC/HybG/HupF family hydrogenase formation chaperone [Rhodocyclaceae bacterium]|nr:MAG: HypC/HybG/HupF family hydrogenase formation chaperone [Rhodocyclaceae bacterium]
MCMATPMQVLRVEGSLAWCRDRDGSEKPIDTQLVDAVAPGQWLLTFLGAAREIVSAEQARQVGDALDALEAALAGDPSRIDDAFADLIHRSPELPDFLRKDRP